MTTKDIKADYGAKGDGKEATAVLTISTTTLTSATPLWVSGDAGIGKKIFIQGAGPSGSLYESTISTYNNANSITLAHAVNTPLAAVSKVVSWGSDDTAAFKAFNAAMTGLTGTVLTIPASSGFYCIWETGTRSVGNSADPCLFTHGIPQITVTGIGTPRPTLKQDAGGEHICGIGCGSIHDLQGPAIMSTAGFTHVEKRVDTVTAGASSVTCTTHADASNFATSDWVLLTAIDAQVGGYPPNVVYYEYFQVTSSNSTTGVVGLTPNVVSDKFLSTYPGGFGSDIELGPATLHKMAPSWNTECNWTNINASDHTGADVGHQMKTAGRLITFTDCTLDLALNATMVKELTALNTDLYLSEIDKINGPITWTGGTVNIFTIQSGSSSKQFTISNCDIFRIAGTPQKMTIDNCTIDEFKVGSQGPAPGQSVTVSNSTVNQFIASQGYVVLHTEDVVSYSTMTGGVMSTLNNVGNGGLVTMDAPGGTWMMCGTGSNPYIYGPAFRILSMTGATPQGPTAGPNTPITITTDLPGGWPTIPEATKCIILCPMPSITFTNTHGCLEADDLSNTPAGLPYLSYLKRSYSKTSLTGTSDLFYVIGKVTSLVINVLTAHTGATSPLIFRPLASGDNEPVVLSNGTTTSYAPKIDLRTAGKRTITPSGVTNDQGVGGGVGGLGADANLTFPQPYIWMYNASRSHISADVSSESGSLSYYWEIITDQGVVVQAVTVTPAPLRLRLRAP